MDFDEQYRAISARDTRFDGRFLTAVHTTGIYCRPSCPARTPARANVSFLPTAAAAQAAGFRACLRCRPDAAPGSPEWNVRADVAARAMTMIDDGVVDREGVTGLAARLGYGERHLGRLLVAELGASPVALARARRAHAARVLIETSSIPFTQVATAAGFASLRQFNDTVREVYARTPTELRAARTGRAGAPLTPTAAGAIELHLPARAPWDGAALVDFLGARAIDGVEHVEAGAYRRSLSLPHGPGVVELRPVPTGVAATVRLASWSDLTTAVARVRALLDLDADPVGIAEAFADDPVLGPLVRRAPGLRAPGAVDAFELAVRAVLGQQVTVAAARTHAGRLVAARGAALPEHLAGAHVTRLFPTPELLVDADLAELRMPESRRAAVRALAAAMLDGSLDLAPGADRDAARRALLAVRGIGPWTAAYVAMRALRDPDALLEGDVGVRNALATLPGVPVGATLADLADAWRPWRTYATYHLWNGLGASTTTAASTANPTHDGRKAHR